MHVTTFIEITIAGRCTHRDRSGEKGAREMAEKRCKESDREKEGTREKEVRPQAHKSASRGIAYFMAYFSAQSR